MCVVCMCVYVCVCVCACVMCNWYASSLALFGVRWCSVFKDFSYRAGVRRGVLSPYLLFTLCAVCAEGLYKQSHNMSQNIASLASLWSKKTSRKVLVTLSFCT